MKHHIIVKLKDRNDRKTVADGVRALFSHLTEIDGIHGVQVLESCIDRSNRYDIMIAIDMEKEALPVYDDCVWHHRWKDEYGSYVESKAIFDCE